MSNKETNIKEIIALQPNGWVNGSFNALVTSAIAAKQAGMSAKATLVDPNDHSIKIEGCFWNVDPVRYDGMVVNFGGAGMKRAEYKGKPQVSVGEKAKLSIVSAAGGTISPAGTAGVHMPSAPSPTYNTVNTKLNCNEELGKLSALYQLAYKQAVLLKNMNEMTDNPFSEKQFESCVASIYISGERKGLANHLPSMPVSNGAVKQVVQEESEENPF